MAITSYSRIQRRGFNFPTSGITVAPSNDHTDGTWGETDAYSGEITINTNTGKLQYISSGTVYTVITDIQNTGQTPTKSVKVVNTTFGARQVYYDIYEIGNVDMTTNDLPTFTITGTGGIGETSFFDGVVYSDNGIYAIPLKYSFNYNALPLDIHLEDSTGTDMNLLVPTTAGSNFASGFFGDDTFTSTTINRGYYIIGYVAP